MMLAASNRASAASARGKGRAARGAATKASKKLNLEDFLANCDYTGGLALLEFNRRVGDVDETTLPWIAYCAFHLGDYRKALDTYEEIEQLGHATAETPLYKACCHYYMREYETAEALARRGPETDLQNRLLFLCANKQGDENKLMAAHQKLKDSKLDQLCLAAVHFQRNHFQEATDIYKRLLISNRDDLALNVYIALCYYKLDYYDVSLEILAVYLQAFAHSAVAINLKACNQFRLYNGRAAETELRALTEAGGGGMASLDESDLIRHNLVVFRGGENALRVLPPLIDVIAEARLNLVIYHLRQGDVKEAFDLMQDVTPVIPPEYILKAVVHAMFGQQTGNKELIRKAQQFFQLVGSSSSECDTIPGRQCMASCFFLLKNFEDVNIYLGSIKPYMFNDADFNWNYGIAQASVGNFREAEEALMQVRIPEYTEDFVYISWLARCFIMNGKAGLAWELYLRTNTSPEGVNLLQLIANDCYKMGAFHYAAKAFEVLERLDPDPEYWEGMRGACIGVFQQFIAKKESLSALSDVVEMLRHGSNPQQVHVSAVIERWCAKQGVKLV